MHYETHSRLNTALLRWYKIKTDKKKCTIITAIGLNLPMIAPQCMLAYGSSPVRISHIAIPNEKTSTCQRKEFKRSCYYIVWDIICSDSADKLDNRRY